MILGLSLCLALIFWLQAVLTQEQSTAVSLPLEFAESDNSQFSALPDKVKCRVTGKGLDIIKLILSNTSAQYPPLTWETKIADLDPGKTSISVLPHLNHVQIEPLAFRQTSKKDMIGRKTVPIEIAYADLDTKQQIQKKKYLLIRDHAVVHGPEEILQSIIKIRTEPVTAEMLKSNAIRLKLVNPDSELRIEPADTELKAPDQNQTTRVFTRVPVSMAKSSMFYPDEITVRVQGESKAVINLTPEQIEVTPDLTKETDGEITLLVKCPPGIRIMDYYPREVNRISRSGSESR